MIVADLTFSQPARRNLAVPILLAIAVLAAATITVIRFTPHSTADLQATRVAVYPSHVVFKSSSIMLNSDIIQDDIYVVPTVSLTNHLRLPIFVKDFHVSLTPGAQTGGPPITSSAVEKSDLTNLFVTFPLLKKLAEDQGVPPLYRDTRVEPSQSATGYVVFHFSGSEAIWNTRGGATLTLDLYHQGSLTADLPKPLLAAAR